MDEILRCYLSKDTSLSVFNFISQDLRNKKLNFFGIYFSMATVISETVNVGGFGEFGS